MWRRNMRRMSLATAVVLVALASPAFAQEWVQFVSQKDFFGVNFPVEPKQQDITYTTEFDIALPGHVYSAESAGGRYAVTVVDYADAERIHTAKADQCRKNGGVADACTNSWRADVQGSIVFATFKFLQRNAKVTHFGWAVVDQVEGTRIQLKNADRSRTIA